MSSIEDIRNQRKAVWLCPSSARDGERKSGAEEAAQAEVEQYLAEHGNISAALEALKIEITKPAKNKF